MTLNEQTSLAVVIPAFNEEKMIEVIVKTITSKNFVAIVIDDGSSDSTALLAKKAGAIVVQHTKNKGYEAALTTGLAVAASRGLTLVATFDADGQMDFADLFQFYNFFKDNNYDLLIGIRNKKNRYSEFLISFFCTWRFGIKDPLCGLKMYRIPSIVSMLPFDSHKLVGMELTLRMAEQQMRIKQIPIHIKKRDNGPSRYGTSLYGEVKILTSLWKLVRIFGVKKMQ